MICSGGTRSVMTLWAWCLRGLFTHFLCKLSLTININNQTSTYFKTFLYANDTAILISANNDDVLQLIVNKFCYDYSFWY